MPPSDLPHDSERNSARQAPEDLYKSSLRRRSRIRAIDWLLHGRGKTPATPVRHHRLHPHSALYEEAPRAWQEEENGAAESGAPLAAASPQAPSHGWVWAVFIGSFLFFLGVAAFSAYVWLGDRNAVSVRYVDLTIEGPLTVGGGEETFYTIHVTNRNPTTLQDAVLVVEFPEGTRAPNDLATPLRAQRFPLGDVEPGGERTQRLRLVFFGNQGEVKELKARVEYGVEGSRATYIKEGSYATTITSSPVVVRMSAVSEVISGQAADVLVEVVNNSERTLQNLLVDIQLPPSVRFLEAQPEPSTGTNLWRIASLPPQATFPIRLTLLPTGSEGEVRSFRVQVGEENPQAPGTLAAVFGSLVWDVRLSSPFVSLALSAEGAVTTTQETIAIPAGTPGRFRITYRNTMGVAVYDLVLEAQLRGEGFDKFSVEPDDNGFYDSVRNVIRWHPRDIPALREIPPGEGGAVAFTIHTLPPTKMSTRAPRFFITIRAQARRVLETQVPEQLEAAIEREVRLATTPQLLQIVRYTDGPFTNTGPIPPKVDERTTYTITWRIINPLNELRNLRVQAQLPSYVEWVGQTYPASANIRFNPVSGVVQWEEAVVPGGVGVNRPPKEVSFQVAIRPSAAQVGESLRLVGEARGEATDAFANVPITLTADAASTDLTMDPAYGRSQGTQAGRVVP